MMEKFSFFKSSKAKAPASTITIDDFLTKIKKGEWRKAVEKYRDAKNKLLKEALPAVTISGEFKSRDKNLVLSDKLVKHSGLICIDIDGKDNPKMSVEHVVDHECVCQFVSCSGEGLKIVYYCKPVSTLEEHWRIYDAIEDRLTKKRINIKVDSIVKSMQSLQYVSYDPNPYINLNSKLTIKPLAAIKKVAPKKKSADNTGELELLSSYIIELKGKDVTQDYEDWNNIAFGLSYSLGEAGRGSFHAISRNYKGYSENECNAKYDYSLERSDVDKPITIATVYDILAKGIGAVKFKQLNKAKGKAVGVGEGEETSPDLAGMVRYKMFLFKKVTDKKSHELIALIPHSLNLIAFADFLQSCNVLRYQKSFVKITDNIVEKVDPYVILWMLGNKIKEDGDYDFQYSGETFHFSWEDILHLWKSIKTQSGIYNSIPSEVPFWEPDLLKDDYKNSYVPFQNGVVHVMAKNIELIPYNKIKQQIWKDLILPREYKPVASRGMFEDFFINVMGRGKSTKIKLTGEHYKRAIWYYGYMLHAFKDPATARAWMLYDINVGNSGRSGKSIIGEALGKIRHVTVIDGKQADFRNRFWLQTVKEFTNIIFIDDPKINTSIIPMFNMITGTVQAEGKGSAPIEVPAKFLFASNWIMESEGVSESARQFISQLEDFYVNYSRQNGDTATPIVHLHGKRFFTEWDVKDWAQFDSFSMRCLQYHLSNETPSNIVVGDSAELQFKQSFGEELFQDLKAAFIKLYEPATKSIDRQRFVEVIKEANPQMNSKACGATARRFLGAIGGGQIGVQTVRKLHLVVNVYTLQFNPRG